jgi:hypothetical protein
MRKNGFNVSKTCPAYYCHMRVHDAEEVAVVGKRDLFLKKYTAFRLLL